MRTPSYQAGKDAGCLIAPRTAITAVRCPFRPTRKKIRHAHGRICHLTIEGRTTRVPKPIDQPELGRRLLALREELALTRAELARESGVGASSIFRLESGDDVRMSTYIKLTNYFIVIARRPTTWMLAQRLVLLTEAEREELVAELEVIGGDRVD